MSDDRCEDTSKTDILEENENKKENVPRETLEKWETLKTELVEIEDENNGNQMVGIGQVQIPDLLDKKNKLILKGNSDVCTEHNSEVQNVCITCKEKLCSVCSKSHGLEAGKDVHQILPLLQFLGDKFPCAKCKISASYHCHSCNFDFCNECRIRHQSDVLIDHAWLDITTHALILESKSRPLCGVCSGSDIIEAHSFCQTCKPLLPLCERCSKKHEKAFSTHSLCPGLPPKNEETESQVDDDKFSVKCIPCKYENESNNATSFCQTCNEPEPMCSTCATQHTRERKTRNHKLCSDLEKLLRSKRIENDPLCENCAFNDITSTAIGFCLNCDEPEPLCKNCITMHLKQKIFRNHQICYELEKIKTDLVKGAKVLYCEPCSFEKENHIATHFCLDCDEPEPLCQECATHHLKQRNGRGHKLCDDIEKISQSTILSDREKDEKTIFCDPCLYDNLQSVATHFCKTCEVPEPQCQDCAKQHLRQRSGRGHILCDDIRNLKSQKSNLPPLEADAPLQPDPKIPGKPKSLKIKSDVMELCWEKPSEKVDHYQIRYKSLNDKEKWKFVETDSDENHVTITGLMANTQYIFQVRGIFGDEEGRYGPVNEDLSTTKSLATMMLESSILVNKNDPSKYQLPVQENQRARNPQARTRQLFLGKLNHGYTEEKTSMLVGATGSGKSTLVDGIINYVLGVSFEDPFRFTMVTLEDEEKKTHNQAMSQTEWITVYRIAPTEGSRLNYMLNIIDTPGFGDTRGIERDHAIVDQIRHLFSAQGEQGVLYIDAVCFLVKAPDARLTVVQKYIFSSIMSLFGKDIESNICTLITFADGAQPPVLASLKESNLHFGATFQFNNSALFAENKNLNDNALSPMFWEMGCKSFDRFFFQMNFFETRSLCQTKNVLEEREQLKTILSNVRPQVSAGLSKLSELSDQLDIFNRYKKEIENNEKFEYQVEETRQEMVDLPKGQHVTNCLNCNVTCHEKCQIADDAEKSGCWAMDRQTGHCRICVEKCIWSVHKNTPYIFKYVTETVKKTYAEMKKRYEDAIGQTLSHEKYIEELTYDVDDLFEQVSSMMNEMNRCKTRLKEIALRPDPLSAVEHIDLMIQSEESEKQPGFPKRVKMLMEMKRMALVDKDVESFSQNIKVTRKNIQSATGKTFTRSRRVRVVKGGNVFSRGLNYVKKLF
ncbi:uncharacterized protein LOC134273000 [Saccostrea cucullata]|uniref:uncharacterized protein LOC134273000 n=1 Tax=Saccostrea cuccullata TaxID=36930 RepID=UPI002ED3BE01